MTPARLDPEVVMVRLERIAALLSDLEAVGEPTADRFEREPIVLLLVGESHLAPEAHV